MATHSNGLPAGLTEAQIELAHKFRERIQDEITENTRHDNYHLCRWLRARLWDLDKAEKMFRASEAWRKKWAVDDMVANWTPPEAMQKYYPGGVCGFDKAHSPVYISPFGKIDMRGLSMSVAKEDLVKTNLYILEMLLKLFEEQTKRTGHKVTQVVVISDLQGFGMKQLMSPGMEQFLKVMALVEANYPECLKQCYVVNAPGIWNLIFKVLRPFMSEDTKRKINVLGSDWKEKLLEIIEPDQLPVHWGGTQTGPDGDTFCSNKIRMGGTVPEEYYLRNQQLVDPHLWKETSISAGSTIDIPFQVEEPGAIINWVFKTEKKDIAFGIVFKDSEEQKTEEQILPTKRVSCQKFPEMGQFECKKVGTYSFQFSNRFSWINSKKLGYHVYLATASETVKRANGVTDIVGTP